MFSFVKIVADSLCLFCTLTIVYKIQCCIFRIDCEKGNIFATSDRTLAKLGSCISKDVDDLSFRVRGLPFKTLGRTVCRQA